MGWLQLCVGITAADAELAESLMLELGACSVTLQDNQDQPILEPGVGETPLWKDIRLTALFSDDCAPKELSQDLHALAKETSLSFAKDSYAALQQRLTFSVLEDKAWEREWLNHFKPIACGNRLWIYPSWETPPNDNNVKLLLDPGLAFGTGTHETTLLCLQWLDSTDVDKCRVLDFGCGSGILGIAALLLGAESAVFVDNDPQALVATQANLEKNGIAKARFTLVHADNYSNNLSDPFDIVLANILATPLIQLAGVLIDACKSDGLLTLSGLQSGQQQAVISAYEDRMEFDAGDYLNEWVRLGAKKKQ